MSSFEKVYDVIGVGFGPSNLSLAVVMEEASESEQVDRLFLEAKPHFVWHPNMLIRDSLLQVVAMKDLITPVNPRSQYTFLNYLKTKDRLYEFLNLRDLYPTRIEFNDYMTWVAEQLAHYARYGRSVERIVAVDGDGNPVPEGAPAALLRVEATNQAASEVESYLARNVVIAGGGSAKLPEGVDVALGTGVLHPASFLTGIKRFDDRDAPYRFVIVGSGQSAGEIFEYLLDSYPNADVTSTIRNYAYKPVDASPFSDESFSPESVDYFHDLPAAKRREMLSSLEDTNFAVIDLEVIQRLYKRLYRQKVLGRNRGRVLPFLELCGLETGPSDTHVAHFRHLMSGAEQQIEADGVVLCTGFDWPKKHPLVDDLACYFQEDELGTYKVERNYAIDAHEALEPQVFLQGYNMPTHGITDVLLSIAPARAKTIERAISRRCLEQRAAPVVAAVS